MLRNRRTYRLSGLRPAKGWLAKLLAGALAGIVVLSLLYAVLLPMLMARIDMRAGMEAALSSLTGSQARIAGAVGLDLWPHPSVSIGAVTLQRHGQPQPFARIGRVAADFDIADALFGRPVFSDFRLTDPVVSIARDANGGWDLGNGTIDPPASEREPAATEPSIGTITIDNGTLDITAPGQGTTQIAGISGRVRWRTPSARLTLDMTAMLKGEAIDLKIVCDSPPMLFSGQAAPLQVTLASQPLNVVFDGTGSLQGRAFWKGSLQLATPSPFAVAHWWHGTTAQSGADPLNLEAAISVMAPGTAQGALRLDDLHLSLGHASATGVLDLQASGPVREGATRPAMPRLAGTLAFDTLDLPALFAAAAPGGPGLAGTTAPEAASIETLAMATMLRSIEADLRLSVTQLTAGPLVVSDVAAGIMTGEQEATLDIGDGTFADGTLTGRLAIPRAGPGGRLQVLLRDADLDRLVSLFPMQGPVPSGRGTLTGDLTGISADPATLGGTLTGTLGFSADSGRIANFDLPAFLDHAAGGQFFALSDAARGTFDYTAVDVAATLKDGVLRIGKAEIVGTDASMTLSGVVRPATGSLAIAGRMKPGIGPLAGGTVRFFAGGAWPDLTITPLSVLSEPQ